MNDQPELQKQPEPEPPGMTMEQRANYLKRMAEELVYGKKQQRTAPAAATLAIKG